MVKVFFRSFFLFWGIRVAVHCPIEMWKTQFTHVLGPSCCKCGFTRPSEAVPRSEPFKAVLGLLKLLSGYYPNFQKYQTLVLLLTFSTQKADGLLDRLTLWCIKKTTDKYMKKGILLILTIFLTYLANAQNCSCEDNFIWLKETFEKNDAGFQFSVDKKGEQEYQKHSDSYAQKVKSISSKQECAETLQQWLRFFREGHLSLQLNGNTTSSTPEKFDPEKVKEQFNSWPIYPYKKVQFDAYISKLTEPELEGIWSDPPYKFGIKKVADQYIGFILEADGVYWRQSQIKFRISEDNDSLSAVYYMRNHTERNFENVKLVGKNHLQIGFVTLKRLAPEFKANEQDINIERQLRIQSTSVPLFEKLTDNTVILRIPSFSYSEKELIDSLIDLHFQ